MLMRLSSWVTTNATPRVGSYSCHSTLHGVKNKNFVAVIFGVWIFGLLHLPDMTVQNAAINISSLGNFKPTVGLSMLKMHIIIITWIDA